MSQPTEDKQSTADAADSQLDALISRIQSLSGEAAGDAPPAAKTQPTGNPTRPQNAEGRPPQKRPPQQQRPPQKRQGSPRQGPPQQGPPQQAKPPQGSANAGPGQPGKPGQRPPARPGGAPPKAKKEQKEKLPVPTKGLKESRQLPMALGFKPDRDEAWRPPEPSNFEEAGIKESMLEAIVYRYLLNMGEAEGRRIANQVRLPFRMVEPLLVRLKSEQNVAYKCSTATNDYVYILTETGRDIARNHASDCTYFGSCPVALEDYIASVKMQTIEGQYPKKADLLRAFSDLLINPKMLERLGPAVASGRGMFLFGFPGNGKTSIAERVTGAFGKYVWVPNAVDVDGDVLRVFDPMNHEMAMPESDGGILNICSFDQRWVRIERPTIVAGGELTMEMLEVQCNPESNISEAPLQLKSNCGTLVIDDFGRQKMRVDELLNRWIVPLEKRYDFLNMASGKKIQVPFDQLVVFSTNLEPKDLVDDAFLRRIPYKIEAENPPEDDFRKLFEIMCKVTKVPHNPDCIEYLIETHYKPVDRPMRMCQPRDLLLQVKNYCLYNDLPIELKNEYFDFACDNYFSVM